MGENNQKRPNVGRLWFKIDYFGGMEYSGSVVGGGESGIGELIDFLPGRIRENTRCAYSRCFSYFHFGLIVYVNPKTIYCMCCEF